ncbi:Small subunit processome component 20-like protein [Nymphaea thermarum]|nr:Small subunit processome component 20-like protein [Nymphaea thermarum]
MAPPVSQPIKSLNTGPGRRRFVFKTFSQRLEDLDVNVFRSLEPVKAEPAQGSTFFKDALVYWRVFTSLSQIFMYLQKFLVKDIVNLLKTTKNLRFYPRDYVQEFAAEALSFLVRSASPEQLIKGANTFAEVVNGAFQRICKELHAQDMDLLLKSLFEEMSDCIKSGARMDAVSALINYDERFGEARLFDNLEVAKLWGTIMCYPHVLPSASNGSLLMDLVNAIDHLLLTGAGQTRFTWQGVIGAALSSYRLSVVRGDFLDDVLRSNQERSNETEVIAELKSERSLEAFDVFSVNLGDPNNEIRLSTLRILCHYEPLDSQVAKSDQPMDTKGKDRPISIHEDLQDNNVAGRVPEAYLPVLVHGLIGVLHIRFSDLQKSSLDCLAVLLERHTPTVWDGYVQYLRHYLLTSSELHEELNVPTTACVTMTKSNDLLDRFHLSLNHPSDSTPPMVVLTLLLQSLQKVPLITESYSYEIIPLFFKFLGYADKVPFCMDIYDRDVCKGKKWKALLKEWLNLFKSVHNPRSLCSCNELKLVLINRFLDDTDSDIQMGVMDILANWKDEELLPYDVHLRNLINVKVLREELTAWKLSKESHSIEESHRVYLIPMVIRILMPKVRKIKALTSRKNAGAARRKAILCFLSQLEVEELPLFFSLCFRNICMLPDGTGFVHRSYTSVLQYVQEVQLSDFFKSFSSDNLGNLQWKKIHGFLHILEDILKAFQESHIKPFLGLLMMLVIQILECCKSSLVMKASNISLVVISRGVDATMTDGRDKTPMLEGPCEHVDYGDKFNDVGSGKAQTDTEEDRLSCDSFKSSNILQNGVITKQYKDIRALCLKILSFVLHKYGSYRFSREFWDSFFISVEPLIENFTRESSSSEKPSSLLSCFLAMSKNSDLVHLFERKQSLVPSILSILSVTSASSSVISAVLGFLENLLMLDEEMEHEHSVVKKILMPHLSILLSDLHGLVLRHKGTQRTITWPGDDQVRLLRLLLKYIDQPSLAEIFISIALQSLEKKNINSDHCVEAMHIIQEVLPLIGPGSSESVLNMIPSVLISAGPAIRLAISDILDGLSTGDPSLTSLAKLVHDLNAMSVSEIDEFDYETRIGAYEKINMKLFSEMKESHSVVILSHCVYDMSSEELLLRQSASKSLLAFVQLSSMVLDNSCEKSADQQSSGRNHENNSGVIVTIEADCCWTMAAIHRTIHKFFLLHMREAMGKAIFIQKEWIALLREMVLHLSGMPMFHACHPLCSEDAEVDFFNNVLHLQKHRRARALLRFKDAVCSHGIPEEITIKVFSPLFFHILFDLKEGEDEHVRRACLESLASISKNLRWESYYKYLMHCFREMRLKPDRSKVLVRLICLILDMFHYYEGEDPDCKEIEISNGISDASNLCTDLEKQSINTCIISPQIQASLQKSVLPQILKIMSADSVKIHVPINVAALKLLKLLPSEIMDSHLSGVIHRIANFLRSRVESERDEARSALTACLKELGPKYLSFVVKILQSTLKRGYELHVLGYTLNFLLSKVEPRVYELDHCLEDLLMVVENDIFGDVGEQKEVGKIASKLKEARKKKSFETLKLIAQSITFKTNAVKLFSPVKIHLKNPMPREKAMVEKMLHNIAEGIEGNPSVDHADLLVFIYGLIEDYLADERFQSKEPAALQNGTRFESEGKRKSFYDLLGNRSNHLIAAFALRILFDRLKKMKLDKSNRELLSMLDPFVELLQNCLQSKYEDILSGSLRLMVTSQSPPMSQRCSKILLQFLMDYPFTPKRLQQHLDFLVENMSYEHASGREAVLEMVYSIIKKFQPKAVGNLAETFILPLVLRLSNELDNQVHAMVAKVIKILVGRIKKYSSTNVLQNILQYGLSWYAGGNPNLWSAAAQFLSLLIEVLKGSFSVKYMDDIRPVMERILRTALPTSEGLGSDSVGKEKYINDAWYSLLLMEKLWFQFADAFFQTPFEGIWELVLEFLMHPNHRLRETATCLINSYFSTSSKQLGLKESKSNQEFPLLLKPSRLFAVASSLCRQLEAHPAGPNYTLCNTIVENLVFAICGVYSFAKHNCDQKLHEYWSSLAALDHMLILKFLELLGAKKEKNVLICFGNENLEEDVASLLVVPLLKKLGDIVLQSPNLEQIKVVLRCFKLILTEIGLEGCLEYAAIFLLPLYKISEGFAGVVFTDEAKYLAEELRDSIRGILGMEEFVRVYERIRKNVRIKRDKRKQAEKVTAVVNPMRSAKRKLRIAEKHRAHKKRKLTMMKMGRWGM